MNNTVTLDWLYALTGLFSLGFMVMTASLGLVWRTGRKWGRTEDRQASMMEQMKYDRDATDRRLRFLEEWLMNTGMGSSRKQP